MSTTNMITNYGFNPNCNQEKKYISSLSRAKIEQLESDNVKTISMHCRHEQEEDDYRGELDRIKGEVSQITVQTDPDYSSVKIVFPRTVIL